MFAQRRILNIKDSPEVKTPILLPSFSSKGFPKVGKILKTMEEFISDEVLVSAYDLHHQKIERPFDFATTIFLDSGGYEASKDVEMSDLYDTDHNPEEWTPDFHASTLASWDAISPTVFVSFDHPNHRCSISDQVARARNLPVCGPGRARSLLIKPESREQIRVQVQNIIPHVPEMTGFATIGVTEKEIGNSIRKRMINIARLRQALDQHHEGIPIHVFGALDTVSTYLYFLAGADIFDGLTWLRYAFHDGDTIYRHQFGTMTLPISTNSDVIEARCWSHNYQYMQQMRLNMIKYSADGDFTHFGKYHAKIKEAYQIMQAEIGVV